MRKQIVSKMLHTVGSRDKIFFRYLIPKPGFLHYITFFHLKDYKEKRFMYTSTSNYCAFMGDRHCRNSTKK